VQWGASVAGGRKAREDGRPSREKAMAPSRRNGGDGEKIK